MDGWIKTVWYLHTIEYHSALKRKEIPPHVTARMDLQDILLSETDKLQKDKPLYDATDLRYLE